MTKHAFIITSAINTKFGVYTTDQRLEQTLRTIDTIETKVPDATIIFMECAAIPLTAEQKKIIIDRVHYFFDFTDDEDVKAIFASPSWDMVKSTTEMMCFNRVLKQCQDNGIFDEIDRVHKISGRYELTDHFDLSVYDNCSDIVVCQARSSQFTAAMTLGVGRQYMSRLWSWPVELTDTVCDVYTDGLNYIAACITSGGYADIEHALYKFLPTDKIKEVSLIGVKGNIAPNGAPVED